MRTAINLKWKGEKRQTLLDDLWGEKASSIMNILCVPEVKQAIKTASLYARLHLRALCTNLYPFTQSIPVWVAFESQSPVEVLNSPLLHIIAFYSCLRRGTRGGFSKWGLYYPPLPLNHQGRNWDMHPDCVGLPSSGKRRNHPQD